MLNENQIECFLAAAKYQNFSAAAAELGLTPQAVSKQVIQLEKMLDVRLFSRNGPYLALTEMGCQFRELFIAQFQELDVLKRDIAAYRAHMLEKLGIGISEWLDPFGSLGDGLTAYFTAHPETKVSLRHMSNDQLFDSLASGALDCALFFDNQRPKQRDYECHSVIRDEMLLYGPDCYLPGPAPRDCWGLPMVTTSGWNWTRTEYRLFHNLGRLTADFEPSELILVPSYSSVCAAMQFSDCVTLSSRLFSRISNIPGKRGYSTGIREDVILVWKSGDENPHLPKLLQHLRDYFGWTA